jgi:Pilus formation protein N terminal region
VDKIILFGVTMLKVLKLSAAAIAIFVGFSAPGFAEQIRVMMDRTQLITMSVSPTTVVVGNPAIADANVTGNQVFINGYSPGTTNIVMLDDSGASIANLEVLVTRASTETAAVFKKGGRQSLICPDFCDPTMEIGDEEKAFTAVQKQFADKRAAALGIISQANDANNSNNNGKNRSSSGQSE